MESATDIMIRASSAGPPHPAILLQLLLLLLQTLRHVLLVHLWILHLQIDSNVDKFRSRGFLLVPARTEGELGEDIQAICSHRK